MTTRTPKKKPAAGKPVSTAGGAKPAGAGRGEAAAGASARERVAAARAETERAERRRKLITRSVVSGIAAVAVGGIAWGAVAAGGSSGASGPLSTPALYGTATVTPPWPAPADPETGVRAAGLSMLSAEGSVLHFHTHLDVFVDGQRVTVPAYVGIDSTTGTISSLHTHDATGVLHIEAPDTRRFVLGQFFDEWDVRLTADQLGGLTAGGADTLTAYVDGKKVTGDPAAIELTPHEEIALVYGVGSVPVPSSYAFPAGE